MTHDNTISGRCDGYRIVDEAAFDEFKKIFFRNNTK